MILNTVFCQQNPRMTERPTGLPADTVRNRLTEIMETCGYSSLQELGDALGESRANLSAWQTRNTYGPTGAVRLHDLTGAALDWLSARGDVAFPNGPKLNSALQNGRLYGDIREIRKELIQFAFALAGTTPKLASAWKKRLEDSESP